MRRLLGIALALALVTAACGDSAATTTSPAAATTVAPATTAAAATTTTVAVTTTTTPATTTTAPLSGEPFDFYVPIPAEGPVVGVVGVQFDDTLNVRSGPNITFDIIADLGPTEMGITGTGEGWQLPSGSLWWEIEADGVTGWANTRFLSRLGGTFDLTSQVVDFIGEIPTAETMLDLGLIVANAIGAQDEEFDSSVTVVGAPSVGDLGEITIDVIGLLDDAQGGWRAHVFGQPIGEGFSLMSVEATAMCSRGVEGDLCL